MEPIVPITALYTFGFKHGDPLIRFGCLPEQVIDIRITFGANPYSFGPLRTKTGLDPDVKRWMLQNEHEVEKKLKHVRALLHAGGQSSYYLGCFGGKHRSVVVGEMLAEYFHCPIVHLDLGDTSRWNDD